MKRVFDITNEENERIGQEIENGLEFTRDVLNDPSLLDRIPSGSHVHAIPKDQCDPTRHYDIETPRMAAIVTPPDRP